MGDTKLHTTDGPANDQHSTEGSAEIQNETLAKSMAEATGDGNASATHPNTEKLGPDSANVSRTASSSSDGEGDVEMRQKPQGQSENMTVEASSASSCNMDRKRLRRASRSGQAILVDLFTAASQESKSDKPAGMIEDLGNGNDDETQVTKAEESVKPLQMLQTSFGPVPKLHGQKRSLDDTPFLVDGDSLTAEQRVFATTELLENILVHLSPKDLLLCQSVCRSFRNCYQESRQLKLKTFEEALYVTQQRRVIRRPEPSPVTPNAANAGNGGGGNATNATNTIINTAAGNANGNVNGNANANANINTNEGGLTSPAPTANTRIQSTEPHRGIFHTNLLLFKRFVPGADGPRRRINHLYGIVGVAKAYLESEQGRELFLHIRFDSHRFSNASDHIDTGSWTKLWVTDEAFPINLVVRLEDSVSESTETGEVVIRKRATATARPPTMKIGPLLALSRRINRLLKEYLFELPRSVGDLRDWMTEYHDEKEPPIKCTVQTTKAKKKMG